MKWESQFSPYLPVSVGNIKRHTLTEGSLEVGIYIYSIAQRMIHEVPCINDICITEGIRTWIDDDVEYDIHEKRCSYEARNQ